MVLASCQALFSGLHTCYLIWCSPNPFCTWGNCITERVCDSSKVMHVISSRARIGHWHHCVRTHIHHGHPQPWNLPGHSFPLPCASTSQRLPSPLCTIPHFHSVSWPHPVFTPLSAQILGLVQAASPALWSPCSAPVSGEIQLSLSGIRRKTCLKAGWFGNLWKVCQSIILEKNAPLFEEASSRPLSETQKMGRARVGEQEPSKAVTSGSQPHAAWGPTWIAPPAQGESQQDSPSGVCKGEVCSYLKILTYL